MLLFHHGIDRVMLLFFGVILRLLLVVPQRFAVRHLSA